MNGEHFSDSESNVEMRKSRKLVRPIQSSDSSDDQYDTCVNGDFL